MNIQAEQLLRELLSCEGMIAYKNNPEAYALADLYACIPGLEDGLDNILSYEAPAHDHLETVLEGVEEGLKFKYETYLHGNCHILAIALHEKYGFPLECSMEYDFDISKLALQHAWVRWDDECIIDVGGLRTIESLKYDFGQVEEVLSTSVAHLTKIGGKATKAERREAEELAKLIYIIADVTAAYKGKPRQTLSVALAQND